MCECVSVTELDSLGSRAPKQTVLLLLVLRLGHERPHMTRAGRQTRQIAVPSSTNAGTELPRGKGPFLPTGTHYKSIS